MAKDGSLGTLLQGVSQQPPAVRPEGKVTQQINFMSDVVQGLTVRPALIEHGATGGITGEPLDFFDVELSGTSYVCGYRAGEIRIWDIHGTEYPITAAEGTLDYIHGQMRPYVFDKSLYVVNRDVVVAKATAPDTTTHTENTGVVYCLGGLFSRTYRVVIRYADGVEVSAEYTTPDGNQTGDAEATSAGEIMSAIHTALEASPDKRAGTILTLKDSTIMVQHDAVFTVQTSDGEDNRSLRAFTTTVQDVEDLSDTAPHGMVVRVKNSDEGDSDDYFLRFNSDISDVVGEGFGDPGFWEEWFDPSQVRAFDLSTMPHVITREDDGSFSLTRGDWSPRAVGDDETNPFPDFVGYAIRDIGGFQSRLVLVAGPWCAMSVSKKPTQFFKSSALAEAADDPIGISSTKEGTVRLDWIIPFDRDLVLMSDPGAGQFVISGSSGLTSSNAAMVQTTAFEMGGRAKPVETGRTILFPFQSGSYSGIKEFFTNDEVATNGADDLTETLDRYIKGEVVGIKCSTNFNQVVVQSSGDRRTVYVYTYLWERTQKLQSSWSEWSFPATVEYVFYRGSELVVVMSEEDTDTGETTLLFNTLDLDLPVNDVAEYRLCLDRQMERVADASLTVTLPYADARFVQGVGCRTPGRQVYPETDPVLTEAGYVYTFDPYTVPEGAVVYCGLRIHRSVSPTMPYPRNREGRVIPRAVIVVNAFLIHFVDTGYLKTAMHSRYRDEPVEFDVDWFPIDGDADDTGGTGLLQGVHHVPWGERNTWSELTISSDDVRPTTILEIEWVGEVFKGSRQ